MENTQNLKINIVVYCIIFPFFGGVGVGESDVVQNNTPWRVVRCWCSSKNTRDPNSTVQSKTSLEKALFRPQEKNHFGHKNERKKAAWFSLFVYLSLSAAL